MVLKYSLRFCHDDKGTGHLWPSSPGRRVCKTQHLFISNLALVQPRNTPFLDSGLEWVGKAGCLVQTVCLFL
jgi:hypothetical protein